MTSVKSMCILLLGYEVIPKTVSTRDRGGQFIMAEPILAYLIETDEGYVIFDTGVNAANLTDPALRQSLFKDRGWLTPPIVLPDHEFLAQLELAGVTPRDIRHVVLSHVHCDHTGNIKHLRHAKFWIQKQEHDYAFSGSAGPAVFPQDYDFSELDWNIVDGDWELMSGIEGILTRGHHPGHQSLVVTLPGGTKVLTADVGDLWENFEQEILPGESCDDIAALDSIRRLKAIAQQREAELILLHDPVRVQQIKLAPDRYR